MAPAGTGAWQSVKNISAVHLKAAQMPRIPVPPPTSMPSRACPSEREAARRSCQGGGWLGSGGRASLQRRRSQNHEKQLGRAASVLVVGRTAPGVFSRPVAKQAKRDMCCACNQLPAHLHSPAGTELCSYMPSSACHVFCQHLGLLRDVGPLCRMQAALSLCGQLGCGPRGWKRG